MAGELVHGDCLDVFKDVRGLASICADPPGGGAFMQLHFDRAHGGRDGWIAAMAPRFRVAREATERGAWGLFWSFGRTAHWTACALDDAGWEYVRPIGHLHGQGWPKARSQLKPAWEIWHLVRWGTGGVRDLQIDRCRVRRSGGVPLFEGDGARRVIGTLDGGPRARTGETSDAGSWPPDFLATHAPACREVGVRKVKASAPIGKPSLDRSRSHVLYGKDARTRGESGVDLYNAPDGTETLPAWSCLAACTCGLASLSAAGGAPERCPGCGEERWWACPVAELDGQSGELQTDKHKPGREYGKGNQFMTRDEGVVKKPRGEWNPHPGEGGASRFFPTFHYDAKASARERQAGCEGLLWVKDKAAPIGWRRVSAEECSPDAGRQRLGFPGGKGRDFEKIKPEATGNVHSTIKPIGCGEDDGLMRWLVRLITPPGGRVGDPFLGSGSTAVAAQIEGHDFIGCDIDPGAVDIARARTAFWTPERHRLELTASAALRAEEKRQEEAAARGQLDWTRGL